MFCDECKYWIGLCTKGIKPVYKQSSKCEVCSYREESKWKDYMGSIQMERDISMGKIEERAKCSLANHFDESRVEFNKEHRNMREWEYGYCQGATEQKAIDIKKFKQWFTKWWESNEYIPLDVCLKSIDKAMEE